MSSERDLKKVPFRIRKSEIWLYTIYNTLARSEVSEKVSFGLPFWSHFGIFGGAMGSILETKSVRALHALYVHSTCTLHALWNHVYMILSPNSIPKRVPKNDLF